MRGKMLGGKRARTECSWGCCRSEGNTPKDRTRLRRMARRREDRSWKKEME